MMIVSLQGTTCCLGWRKSFEIFALGIDGEIDDDEGGFIKLDVVDQDIVIRLKNIQLGEPTIREETALNTHPHQWNVD